MCVHIYMCGCPVCTFIHVHKFLCVFMHARVHMRVYAHFCVCAHVHVCSYVYVFVCIHVFICASSSPILLITSYSHETTLTYNLTRGTIFQLHYKVFAINFMYRCGLNNKTSYYDEHLLKEIQY